MIPAHIRTRKNCVRIFRAVYLSIHFFVNVLITAIPLSPYSFNQNRILRIFFDFPAQVTDVYHNSIAGAVIVWFVPYGFVKTLCRKELMFVLDEKCEDGIFHICQYQRLSVGQHFFLFRMNLQMMVFQYVVRDGGTFFSFVYLISADECFAAADQFIVGERLFEVIVSAAGKAKCLITVLCTGAQKKNRCITALADFKTCLLYTSPSPRDS